MIATLVIPGAPQGKGRPRFSTRSGYPRAYTPEDTAAYENLVRSEYRRQCGYRWPENMPLDVTISAYYPIPKSTGRAKRRLMVTGSLHPTKKPDADNIIKIIADALNKTAYDDDKQIVSVSLMKLYDDDPRVVVQISDMEG